MVRIPRAAGAMLVGLVACAVLREITVGERWPEGGDVACYQVSTH
jgi:hypothetical protein